MLFRTVYGPELEAIYAYSMQRSETGEPTTRAQVRTLFLVQGAGISSQSVDDAIAFLISAGLLTLQGDYLQPTVIDDLPFALKLLATCRQIELEKDNVSLDVAFTLILSEIFIGRDQIFVEDLHSAVNNLEAVIRKGGISKEKIQAWKRVMEFLGVGHRAFDGFICAYSPTLFRAIVGQWSQDSGTLQEFFEQHFATYLPYLNRDGVLARGVANSLQFVRDQGYISLYPLQDSPSKVFLGNLRGIRRSNSVDY